MKWIGLTGGIASGKSSVAKIIAQKGIPVIDADEIARFVVKKGSPGLAQVVAHFGSSILNQQGELDRAALAQLVFGDQKKLFELENILHPLIKQEVREQRQVLEKAQTHLAFYDVPLLFEKNMQKDFDEIVLVTTSRDLQLSRMQARDGFSFEQAEARLKNQIPLSEKEAQATRVIYNNGNLHDLELATNKLIQEIQSAKP
jgi:dephospho-CoA kinase